MKGHRQIYNKKILKQYLIIIIILSIKNSKFIYIYYSNISITIAIISTNLFIFLPFVFHIYDKYLFLSHIFTIINNNMFIAIFPVLYEKFFSSIYQRYIPLLNLVIKLLLVS